MQALRRADIHQWYGRFCKDLDSVAQKTMRDVKIDVESSDDAADTPGWWRRTWERLFNSRVS
jgi:hypothetical protein